MTMPAHEYSCAGIHRIASLGSLIEHVASDVKSNSSNQARQATIEDSAHNKEAAP